MDSTSPVLEIIYNFQATVFAEPETVQ